MAMVAAPVSLDNPIPRVVVQAKISTACNQQFALRSCVTIMLRLKYLCSLVLFGSTPILGYKIDNSCHDAGLDQDVQTALRSAFGMASSALNKLGETPLRQE